jgi:hypothetical protein
MGDRPQVMGSTLEIGDFLSMYDKRNQSLNFLLSSMIGRTLID